MDLFSHLKFQFDLVDGKVSTETAAKDIQGEPYYWHVFDLKDGAQVGIASTAVAATVPTPPAPATAPKPPTSAPTPPTTVPAPPVAKPAPPTSVPTSPPTTKPLPNPVAPTAQPGFDWKAMNEMYTKPPPDVAAADAFWAERRKAEADYFARLYDPNYGKEKTTTTQPAYAPPAHPSYPNTYGAAPQQPYDPQADAIAKWFSLADSEVGAEG